MRLDPSAILAAIDLWSRLMGLLSSREVALIGRAPGETSRLRSASSRLELRAILPALLKIDYYI